MASPPRADLQAAWASVPAEVRASCAVLVRYLRQAGYGAVIIRPSGSILWQATDVPPATHPVPPVVEEGPVLKEEGERSFPQA